MVLFMLIFCSGAPGLPSLPNFMGPVTLSQARKPRFRVFHLIPNLTRSKSVNSAKSPADKTNSNRSSRMSRSKPVESVKVKVDPSSMPPNDDDSDGDSPMRASLNGKSKENFEEMYDKEGDELAATGFPVDEVFIHGNSEMESSSGRINHRHKISPSLSSSPSPLYGLDAVGISSLPDLRAHRISERMSTPASMSSSSIITQKSYPTQHSHKYSHFVRPVQPQNLSPSAKVKLLKSNYFRYETSFAYALQAISTRLRLVPKPARLSALRAEITLLNNELPAEIDIPTILESDTYNATFLQYKVVRISPSEATILNSAEKVPFLMMIEVLKDEVGFDITAERNQQILKNPPDYRSLFDLGYAAPSMTSLHLDLEEPKVRFQDEVLTETELGDISTSSMIGETGLEVVIPSTASKSGDLYSTTPPRESSVSSLRNSDLSFASTYQVQRPVPGHQNSTKLNDAAIHVRTAATMLAQLDWASSGEATGNKISKEEILQIKSRIITSMQHLEEESAFVEVDPPADSKPDPSMTSKEAGERRLENDMKTGAIESGGSFSSIAFGEEWSAKRERIRKSSPFGQLPNWELVSVIAKTGSDLRQEAFACQLILAIKRIFEEANVDVWIRRMVILVTGASSGLVETITNAVSIHSLKKALATSIFGPGNHTKVKISSLMDYFLQAFGDKDSPKFKAAQIEFIRSLAAYSLISYILQIKDRHNGNILLDNQGHIIRKSFADIFNELVC